MTQRREQQRRRRDLWCYLSSRTGGFPSNRELMIALGYQSRGALEADLAELDRLGYIARQWALSRPSPRTYRILVRCVDLSEQGAA